MPGQSVYRLSFWYFNTISHIVCATLQHLGCYWHQASYAWWHSLLYCHQQMTSLSSNHPPVPTRPSEQRLGFLLEGDWAWHPAPALSCFVWGRVPVSGTTISGARPVPLITERCWISERAEHLTAAPADNSLAIHVLAVAQNLREQSLGISCYVLAWQSASLCSLFFRRDVSKSQLRAFDIFLRGFTRLYFRAEEGVTLLRWAHSLW